MGTLMIFKSLILGMVSWVILAGDPAMAYERRLPVYKGIVKDVEFWENIFSIYGLKTLCLSR